MVWRRLSRTLKGASSLHPHRGVEMAAPPCNSAHFWALCALGEAVLDVAMLASLCYAHPCTGFLHYRLVLYGCGVCAHLCNAPRSRGWDRSVIS